MEPLKVSSKSAPNAVAGAIAGVIRESGSAELQAVGAGAANQAIKAVAIARGYLAPAGIDLVCIPAFASVVIDGEERTAIRLIAALPEICGWSSVRELFLRVPSARSSIFAFLWQ